MKLTFDNTLIDQRGEVYFGNNSKYWVRYNGVIVWRKDFTDNSPLNLTASEGQVQKIFVDWSPPEGQIPEFYNLYRDGKLYKTRLTQSYFLDSGLKNAEYHEYYATAVYQVGGNYDESTPSNTDSGITKDIAGSQTFTSNGYFTVPAGVTKLKLCMISGGNGGFARADNSAYSNHTWNSGGGKAGQLVEKIINVYPGQQFKVNVGAGGRKSSNYGDSSGQGGATSFGSVIAYPSSHVYHWGNNAVTGQSGCLKNCYSDGSKVNCTIRVGNTGSRVFTSDTTWTVPSGVSSVNLCMIGGGGGGKGGISSLCAGYSGNIVSQSVSLTPG